MRFLLPDVWTLRAIGLGLILVVVGCSGDAPALEVPAEEEQPTALSPITRPADGAQVHLVRLVQRGDQYGFEPSEITIEPDHVLRFVMTGAQPESVAFDPAETTSEAAQFIRQHDLHRGVLLTEAGQAFDVSFAGAPAGRYPFVSVPHGARGMRGAVVVTPPE